MGDNLTLGNSTSNRFRLMNLITIGDNDGKYN
jgi:hypothetical protein